MPQVSDTEACALLVHQALGRLGIAPLPEVSTTAGLSLDQTLRVLLADPAIRRESGVQWRGHTELWSLRSDEGAIR